MSTPLYEYYPEDFFNSGIKILHGYSSTEHILQTDFFKDKTIKLSDNLVVFEVNDTFPSNKSKLKKTPFSNKEQIIDLIEDPFTKWITKPRCLLNYLKKHYNELPEYYLYLDSNDTLVIDDILDPKSLLEYYQADMLFNCEPNFTSTGFIFPSAEFYNPFFGHEPLKYEELNFKKYKVRHQRSLNAGVFLAKKEQSIPLLEEACYYMQEDSKRGFPYGCMDDQYMFRYLQNKHFDKISVDVFNHYFLFAYPLTVQTDKNNREHYHYFKNNYQHLYTPTL